MKAHASWAKTMLLTAAAASWVWACGAAGGTNETSGGGTNGGNSGSGASTGGLNLDAGGGLGGVGGSSGGGTCRAEACVTSSHEGEGIPLDMYIMMDRSGSMNDSAGGSTIWDAVKGAFIQFVQSPDSDGIGVGIQFFPLGDLPCQPFSPPPCLQGCTLLPFVNTCFPTGGGSCEPNDYLPPAVIIQPLPGVAPAIVNALNGTGPGGGTPTLPAMQSAVSATTAYAQQVPGHKVIIVLATDGEPNDCNSTVPGVADVAGQAFNGNPSIPTFVIGIGNLAGLDQIAQAGGTGAALVVNPATAGQDFLNAMNDIRGRALSCDFNVPAAPAGEIFDPRQVNVQFTPPTNTCEVVYHVGGEAQCDPALGGWFYDDPNNPGLIRTCPATCDRLKIERGRVDVQLGCETVDIPQ